MFNSYKGWDVTNTGHGYEMTRREKVNGETIVKRAKTQEHARTVITNAESDIARREAERAKKERETPITKRYHVTFNKPEYNGVYEFTRSPSAFSPYGNQTSVSFFKGFTLIGVIDTRYDHEVMRDFDAWCIDYLKNYFDPSYEPQITPA